MTTRTVMIGEDVDPAKAQPVTLHRLTRNYAAHICEHEPKAPCRSFASWWFEAKSPNDDRYRHVYVCSMHTEAEAESLWGIGWDLR